MGTRLPAMTAREVERILERAGFVHVRDTDHRIYRKGGRTVPVPMHRGDLKPGTLQSIVKLAGMTADEFLSYRK